MASIPAQIRKKCEMEKLTTHTSGLSPGHVQANLLVLPNPSVAQDFIDLCKRNPVPCPLLGITPIGSSTEVDNNSLFIENDFDIATNFPRYTVYNAGKLICEQTDIKEEWTDQHVGFLIGCSFSFEAALAKNNLPSRNSVQGKNVSMYKSTRYLSPAGVFVNCPLVVSMRPYKLSDLAKVREITREYQWTHGEPIDWGYDAMKRLGIRDIRQPDFGEPTEIAEDEIPIFWGCGVTPQFAASVIGSQIKGNVMAHSPGHMIILDLTDEEVKNLGYQPKDVLVKT